MKIEMIEKITYSKTDNAIMDMVAEQLSVDRKCVFHGSNFIDDLGADSLDQVELIMAFEELLDCEVPDPEAENMLTVKDVFDHCERENLSI